LSFQDFICVLIVPTVTFGCTNKFSRKKRYNEVAQNKDLVNAQDAVEVHYLSEQHAGTPRQDNLTAPKDLKTTLCIGGTGKLRYGVSRGMAVTEFKRQSCIRSGNWVNDFQYAEPEPSKSSLKNKCYTEFTCTAKAAKAGKINLISPAH